MGPTVMFVFSLEKNDFHANSSDPLTNMMLCLSDGRVPQKNLGYCLKTWSEMFLFRLLLSHILVLLRQRLGRFVKKPDQQRMRIGVHEVSFKLHIEEIKE